MEPMRKIATSITIDPDLIGRMDQAAADLDRSRSYVARLAFEEFLHPDRRRWVVQVTPPCQVRRRPLPGHSAPAPLPPGSGAAAQPPDRFPLPCPAAISI